jgi:hypothetical protein
MGLQVDDQVQEVNGTMMIGAPHDVLLRSLKAQGHELGLVVKRASDGESSIFCVLTVRHPWCSD